MAALKNVRPLLRASIVLGAVGLITTAATFAALQSPQAVLANNTINSATADLRINKDGVGVTTSITGFTFDGVTPGGAAAPANGFTFYLKNLGTANLSIKAGISTTPTITTIQPNGSTVDLTKVSFEFTRVDTGAQTIIPLKALMDGMATGGVLLNDTVSGNNSVQYNLKVSMAADAFNAQSATISGINLVFSGTGV